MLPRAAQGPADRARVARQRHGNRRDPRSSRPGRDPHGVVPQRLGRRSGRQVRHRAFSRTSDVQGHRQAHPKGEFSEVVAELGGQENAFTSNDYTAYFQRIREGAPRHADGIRGRPDDGSRAQRRGRRSRSATWCSKSAACAPIPIPARSSAKPCRPTLFSHHPYGTPIIGWSHEIEGLDRADALDYYDRFYTPENAILVVAGDVDHDEVERPGRATIYGRIPARGAAPTRVSASRSRSPAPIASSRWPTRRSSSPAPSASTSCRPTRPAKPGEAAALEVLAHLLGGGQTSLLYKRARARQQDRGRGRRLLHGDGARRDALLSSGRFPPTRSRSKRSTPRSKPSSRALATIWSTPRISSGRRRGSSPMPSTPRINQASLARWYGAASGDRADGGRCRSGGPHEIEAVTAEDARAAAATWLLKRRAVTGFLVRRAKGRLAAA